MVASVRTSIRPKGQRMGRGKDLPADVKGAGEGGTGRRKKPSAAADYSATFTLDDGQVSIALNASGEAVKGDLIQLYAGDYLIGSGSIAQQPRGGLFCNVSIDHAPAIGFPATIRAMLPRLNDEIVPGLNVASLAELQAKMGRHGLDVHLAMVQDRAIGFDVTVSCLPAFPRSLTLNLGGRPPAKAISKVPTYSGEPLSLVHSAVFSIQAAVRDGMSIELIDDATGLTVFESTMTWMNLINPVLAELRTVHQQQEALTARLDAMRKQIMASVDPGRERLLLQRLDLTYQLLNERLDRELKWLSRRVDPAEGEKIAVEHLSEIGQAVTHVSPSGLQGVGIYDGETNGADTWRWFSRTVTLFLSQIDVDARTLRFSFTTTSPALDLTRMTVLANSYDAPFEWRYSEGRLELIILLSRMATRPDRTLILTIDFGQGWNAENDARVLTFACTGLDIES